jgi:hypothetical protein
VAATVSSNDALGFVKQGGGMGRGIIILGLVSTIFLMVGALAADPPMPADPVAPASDQACLALHAEYRSLIEQARDHATTCHAEQPGYMRERYGHQAGEGECARRIFDGCRHYVETCTALSQEAVPALQRCRAALQP